MLLSCSTIELLSCLYERILFGGIVRSGGSTAFDTRISATTRRVSPVVFIFKQLTRLFIYKCIVHVYLQTTYPAIYLQMHCSCLFSTHPQAIYKMLGQLAKQDRLHFE